MRPIQAACHSLKSISPDFLKKFQVVIRITIVPINWQVLPNSSEQASEPVKRSLFGDSEQQAKRPALSCRPNEGKLVYTFVFRFRRPSLFPYLLSPRSAHEGPMVMVVNSHHCKCFRSHFLPLTKKNSEAHIAEEKDASFSKPLDQSSSNPRHLSEWGGSPEEFDALFGKYSQQQAEEFGCQSHEGPKVNEIAPSVSL